METYDKMPLLVNRWLIQIDAAAPRGRSEYAKAGRDFDSERSGLGGG